MNKSGQLGLFSILIVVALLFVFAIVAHYMGVFQDNIYNQIDEDNVATSTQANQTIQDAKGYAIPIMDNMIFWLFGAFILGLLMFSIFMKFHPAVIIVLIIILLITVFLAMQVTNMYDDMRTDLADEIQGDKTFTLSNATIGSKVFPLVLFIVSIAGLWIIFGKKGGGGGGGF